jgi:hypothetical protein
MATGFNLAAIDSLSWALARHLGGLGCELVDLCLCPNCLSYQLGYFGGLF